MANFRSLCLNINVFFKYAQITLELHIILNLFLQQLVCDTTFYVGVLKSVECMTLYAKQQIG
jgi:hypothetical protein